MKSKLKNNQRGMASIAIAMVIMILITLLVTSVALVTRREQRRSLDRQLNTQAFNAIEAGISDAKAAISGASPIGDVANCTGPGSFTEQVGAGVKSEIGSNITYSCVLINKTNVTNYQKTVANPADGAFIVPIESGPGETISTIRVSWQEKSGVNSFTSDYMLSNGIGSPVLRTVLLPNYSGKSKGELTKLSHTMFLFPKGNTSSGLAGNTSFIGDVSTPTDTNADPRQGQFVNGNCHASNAGNGSVGVGPKRAEYSCNVDIAVGGGASKYYLVIQPLYKSASVDITAFDSSDKSLTLLNGQAIIDVTARAGDVIKRVQARVPSGESNELNKGVIPYPGAAVATVNSLCKTWTHEGSGLAIQDPVCASP